MAGMCFAKILLNIRFQKNNFQIHHGMTVFFSKQQQGLRLPQTLDPSPLSRTLHRRAEFHPLLSSHSPPQRISPQGPIVIITRREDELLHSLFKLDSERNRRTAMSATSTCTAQLRRCTMCVTKADTGYVVAALSGPRPYGSTW